jgi:hypothetical protein
MAGTSELGYFGEAFEPFAYTSELECDEMAFRPFHNLLWCNSSYTLGDRALEKTERELALLNRSYCVIETSAEYLPSIPGTLEFAKQTATPWRVPERKSLEYTHPLHIGCHVEQRITLWSLFRLRETSSEDSSGNYFGINRWRQLQQYSARRG